MNSILGLMVALLWSIACFRLVGPVLKKAHHSNAPRPVNALTSGVSVTLAIGILAALISLGIQFVLNSVHFFWPSKMEINVFLSLIWIMFVYAIFKAVVCGVMASIGALWGRSFCLFIVYASVGLLCLPVLFFLPLIGG